MKKYESIPFLTDDGQEVEFCVMEQTMVNGVNYLLVSESQEEESEEDEITVYIMKESGQGETDGMGAYEMVEEEEELLSISKIFEQLMEDMDIEVE